MRSLNVDISQLNDIVTVSSDELTVFLVKTVSIETPEKITVHYKLWGRELPEVSAIIKSDDKLPPVIGYHLLYRNNEAKITFFKKVV